MAPTRRRVFCEPPRQFQRRRRRDDAAGAVSPSKKLARIYLRATTIVMAAATLALQSVSSASSLETAIASRPTPLSVRHLRWSRHPFVRSADRRSRRPIQLGARTVDPAPDATAVDTAATTAADDRPDVPIRFLRATKGNADLALRRYKSTLAWRSKHSIDTILDEPHPHFDLIKEHYPHYHHLTGRNDEPVYYEFPPRTNIRALKRGGVTLDELLRHYALVCEYTWQILAPAETAQSIYVMDLNGIKVRDFAGEAIKFVRRASAFTRDHYPERLGTMFVLNVPPWFDAIWRVVKPMADVKTRKKIFIMKRGNDEGVRKALEEKIPKENIPPLYGGESCPMGESPEEIGFIDLIHRNNAAAAAMLENDSGGDLCSH